MTREQKIKDAELGLAVAKARLIEAVRAHERAVAGLVDAESEHAKYAELLGRLAYNAGGTP